MPPMTMFPPPASCIETKTGSYTKDTMLYKATVINVRIKKYVLNFLIFTSQLLFQPSQAILFFGCHHERQSKYFNNNKFRL